LYHHSTIIYSIVFTRLGFFKAVGFTQLAQGSADI